MGERGGSKVWGWGAGEGCQGKCACLVKGHPVTMKIQVNIKSSICQYKYVLCNAWDVFILKHVFVVDLEFRLNGVSCFVCVGTRSGCPGQDLWTAGGVCCPAPCLPLWRSGGKTHVGGRMCSLTGLSEQRTVDRASTTETHRLTVLEAGSPKSRESGCWRAPPLEGSREVASLLSWLLVGAGSPQGPSAGGRMVPVSASLINVLSRLSLGLCISCSHPNSVWPHLNVITSAKTPPPPTVTF